MKSQRSLGGIQVFTCTKIKTKNIAHERTSIYDGLDFNVTDFQTPVEQILKTERQNDSNIYLLGSTLDKCFSALFV